jgi:membrane protein DedA with SNARE-associated domain
MSVGILLALAAGTLVSEDLTSISAGLLARDGVIGLLPASAACATGVYAGDLGLWALGRVAGRRALRWNWVARRFDSAMVASLGAGLDNRVALAIIASRFLPGSRLPMYLAFGVSGQRPWAFAAWSFVAVLLWTPLLVLLTAAYGASLTSPLLGQLGNVSQLVVTAVVLMTALRLATRALAPTSLRIATTSAGRKVREEPRRVSVSPGSVGSFGGLAHSIRSVQLLEDFEPRDRNRLDELAV